MSNFDLWEWCGRLKIPLKGIFARNERMEKNHSPCVINLDSLEGTGTHWVCCWFSQNHFEYFDSFGLPPPLEWEANIRKWFRKMKTFQRNNFQIQDFPSLKCGYYCICFLNEKKKNKDRKYEDILKMFSSDPKENEKISKITLTPYKMTKSYCIKQKKQTEDTPPFGYMKSKNGRLMWFSHCAECGTKKPKFVKQGN